MVGTGTGSEGRLSPGTGGGVTVGSGNWLMMVPIWSCRPDELGEGEGCAVSVGGGCAGDVVADPEGLGVGDGAVDGAVAPGCGPDDTHEHGVAPRSSVFGPDGAGVSIPVGVVGPHVAVQDGVARRSSARTLTRSTRANDCAACDWAAVGSAGITARRRALCALAKEARTCNGCMSWERANTVVRSFVPALVSASIARRVEITRELTLPPKVAAPATTPVCPCSWTPTASGLPTSPATSCSRVRANCRCRSPFASVDPARASWTCSTPRLMP